MPSLYLNRYMRGHCGQQIAESAKPSFERLRRARDTVRYFYLLSPENSPDEATGALTTSRKAVEAVERLVETDPPSCLVTSGTGTMGALATVS